MNNNKHLKNYHSDNRPVPPPPAPPAAQPSITADLLNAPLEQQ